MSERTASVAEAKAHLSELIAAAEAGDDVVITRRGKPVAALVATARPRQRKADLAWSRELTAEMPYQEEDSGTFVRRMRDAERFDALSRHQPRGRAHHKRGAHHRGAKLAGKPEAGRRRHLAMGRY